MSHYKQARERGRECMALEPEKSLPKFDGVMWIRIMYHVVEWDD